MIQLLARLFIKDHNDTSNPRVRQAYGILCGIAGIFFNLLLFAGKYLAGTLSASIAITADAFNNLSDAGSSLITLLGFKLAGQAPDHQHPYGHGRMEYISGLIVSLIILLLGFELARSSVEKILHPETAAWDPLSLIILVASILVKGYMAFYNRRIAARIDSAAMRATATDSLSDMIATFAVLLATLAGHFFHWQIDGWCGLLVSLFILFSGFGAARDTISPLLGQPPSPETVQAISDIVLRAPLVEGMHDLVIHDYGPGRKMISLHAEVPADCDILAAHDVIDNIENQLKSSLGFDAVIHMDPIDVDDENVQALHRQLIAIAHDIGSEISLHDFRLVSGATHTNLIFDAVVPYRFALSDQEVKQVFQDKVRTVLGPQYYCVIKIDKPFS